jgi:dTDP-4-amino-4,6-dideoxygalactose transaminase
LFHPKNEIQKAIGRIAVLSDGAHSLGAEKNGVKSGAFADFTSFSFHAVKNMTTAEGGATTWREIEGIDNDELYRQYQLYSLHGQSKDALSKTKAGAWEYDILGPYYKYNMTDIAAAMGLKQLERYETMLERRFAIIQKYDEVCDRLSVSHLVHKGEGFRSSGHLYLTRIPGASLEQRNAIIDEMAGLGVACNVHYKPLPMMTAYKNLGFDIADYPNAYAYYENEITLPLHTRLTDEDVEYVVVCFEKVVSKYI